MLIASTLLAAACSTALADRPAIAVPPSRIALGIAPPRIRAPYDVQIIRENGETLPTYQQHGRYYVQGNVSDRYMIRIANPTDRRIEAVVTVDGLDVIDGENGDLRKRGYVVPAYGETRIEGFRTSVSDVATFRFSSVGGSYAGQKGKARNVGVIAVALFEETAPPREQEIIVGEAPPRPPPRRHRPYDYRSDLDRAPAPMPDAAGSSSRDVAKSAPALRDEGDARGQSAEKRAAEPAPPVATRPASPSGAGRYMPPPADYDDESVAMPQPRPRERLGLGTEFGEQRYSATSYTRFVRAPGRPVAIAELRYNDAAGLLALGIPVEPLPDAGELMTRETANPFPGDRFARPVR
ncbi:MAG TPA: hypothetical protein VLM79_29650 [Kofleriaceae bacterium]|nr:hypothetical protein [Kofleriaceae bacterium]